MIQQVEWKSKKSLPCDRCPPVAAILCVNPALIAQKTCPIDPLALPEITAETDYPWQTISAVVLSVMTIGEGCHKWFLYTASYDDSQLIPGNTLDPKDIHGVICDDTCLTSWVREQIGNDVKLEIDPEDSANLILTNQHGCQFLIAAGTPAPPDLCSLQDQSAHGFVLPAYGVLPSRYDSGSASYVLAQADDTLNVADLLVVGIPNINQFVLSNHDGLLYVQNHSLDVGSWYVVDPTAPGNLISQADLADDAILQRVLFVVSPDCLYLSLQPAQNPASEGGSDWHILGNSGTVDGTNFIGTTDNVAFDTRVNNTRVRRSVPNATSNLIIDGHANNAAVGAGCAILGGGSAGDPNNIQAGNFSIIVGGEGNIMIPDATPVSGSNAGYSFIGGGQANFIEEDPGAEPWSVSIGNTFQGFDSIVGGLDNYVLTSDYGSIIGGFSNFIQYDGSSDFCAENYCSYDTVCGGYSNYTLGDGSFIDPLNLPWELGYNFVGGGNDSGAELGLSCAIAGGDNNLTTRFGNLNLGWHYADVIAGGSWHRIGGAQRSSILGGGVHTLEEEDSSAIVSGYLNIISHSTAIPCIDANRSFLINDPPNSTGVGNVILGGEANQIIDGRCSSILGGAFLQLGEFSVGYQSAETRDFTDIASAGRNVFFNRSEPPQIDLSAFSGLGYFGDVDLWIANTDNTARKVKFFEPNLDTDFSSTNYSSFEAQAQTVDIEYILPASLPAAGNSLKAQTVLGSVVTLEWA